MEAVETTSLFRRDDTFLGVCQALGEDFGFNPVFLRIAFAAPLIFAPVAVIATYFGLGIVVLISRMLAPRPKRKAAVQAVEQRQVETPRAAAPAPAMIAEADADQFALPMAA
jgi:phage shock protein PspC (stress-responsive transcriptional regulator)